MRIFVNGKEAVLKKGTSFEYVSENRLFTGSDSYTLSISFPMKDCFVNQQIFGFLSRMDVPKVSVTFECEIVDGTFQKVGVLVITQVSETEVKGQFLEGRSEQNYNISLDDIYINELSLGYAPSVAKSSVSVADAWKVYPSVNWVALPWVNNTSGVLHNAVVASASATDGVAWEDASALTFQPYLVYILIKVCEAIGYSCDFTALKSSKFCYLVIMNSLPPSWGSRNFADALPRWSVAQLFEEVENLTDGEFVIDHKTRMVSFRFNYQYAAALPEVVLENVIDAYTADVSQEEQSQYIGRKNICYSDNGSPLWCYLSCRWYIDIKRGDALVFDYYSELYSWAQSYLTSGVETVTGHTGAVGTQYFVGYRRGSEGNRLLYCREVDTFFVMYNYKVEVVNSTSNVFGGTTYWYRYYYRVMPVNQFGMRLAGSEAEEVTLSIVPIWVDATDDQHGDCVFLECGEYDGASLSADSSGNTSTSNGGTSLWFNRGGGSGTRGDASYSSSSDVAEGIYQPDAGRAIERGEVVKAEQFFDKLYVGFWCGAEKRTDGRQPVPSTDCIRIEGTCQRMVYPFSLRLDGTGENAVGSSYIKNIDAMKKHTFSFLASAVPDPMSVFCIRGIRYLCEKITATFSEKGMSQMMKGVFYRIVE